MESAKPRKITQIAASEAGASNGYSRYLFALCDDGTLWERDVSSTNNDNVGGWQQICLPPPG